MECTSCEKNTAKSVKFPCPKCGKELRRCEKCRSLSVNYTCPKCGHVGP